MTSKALGWREASKDLGFFPGLFSAVFGTPAIVTLIQIAFETGSLAAPLQIVIDAYQVGMARFGAIVEPPIQAFLDAYISFDLQLHPHWRHFLVMSATLWLAGARILALNTRAHDFSKELLPAVAFNALRLARGVLVIAVGCLAVGLVPLEGGWWAQGLIAWLAASTILSASDAHITLSMLYGSTPRFSFNMFDDLFNGLSFIGYFIPVTTLPVFALGAALSFVPGLADSAAIVVVMALTIALGLVALMAGIEAGQRKGLDEKEAAGSRNLSRYSLALLGGFLGAGIVFAASWAMGL